jgi:hypothetical protein
LNHSFNSYQEAYMDAEENKFGQKPSMAGEGSQALSSAYDKTSQVVSDAYDKTSEVVSSSYDQAMSYGRENPAKMTLITFGIGVGVGLLLAAAGSRGSRSGRFTQPIIAALQDIAGEYFG